MPNELDNFGSVLQIEEGVVFVGNVSKPVEQIFVHVPGMAVLCADISVHEPVECLKKFLRYKLQNRANFYTARNKKLKTELSFYEQGLENECNIFIRFIEGLVGGSANFPQDPSSDELQDSGYAEYQQPGFTDFHPGHGYHGSYQTHGYQAPILQNPGMHFPPEPYTVNYHQYNEIHYPGYDQNVEPNFPSYNHMGYGYTGGRTHRGNKTNSKQKSRGAPLRYPGPPQNQFHQSSLELPFSTTPRTPTSPVEKESQHKSSAHSPSPRLASNNIATLSETKSEIESGAAMNVEGTSNVIMNYGSAKYIPTTTSQNSLKANQNVGKISKGKDNIDISADGSFTMLVSGGDITEPEDGKYNITVSKLLKKKSDHLTDLDNPAEASIRSSSSKVFSPGLASRDIISDTFSENYSSATIAFSATSVETTKSLTGKPVIQASDKESSVTDVMNHEFKSLTTGDFMLTLKCRQFYEIPSEILSDHRCKHTTKISISSNRLREIPKYLDIDHFPSMKILDASKNKLVDLPPSIAEFRGMENLDISHNQCRIFPEVISNLKRLKILKVNNNSIEYVPVGLGFYKDLEILRLEGNKLGSIPEDIMNLQNLQYLNISDNRLDDFPLVICQLKNLQFLYMSSNKIKEVPHYLYMNESLEVVQVDKNPIVKPPPDVLARPIQEIRRYCKEIVAGRFKDDRILIVVQGSSNSGKSSVCSALCSDVTQRAVKPTEGIEERSAVIRDINVTIRDFSGDAHYKGLTEIFIVQNALYTVTVDLEQYKNNVGNQDWFETNVWQYLKKVGESQTVFIVGTHADKVEQEAEGLLERLIKKIDTALKNENKLLHLMKGSVNNTIDSFDLLKDAVTRCLLDRSLFPERGQYRPVHWKNAEQPLLAYRKVNQAMNAQQKTALWVPFKTVSDMLMQMDFQSPEDIKAFLKYLRCVGSILWHEGRHLLKTFICANPALLIKAIKIILSKDHKEAFVKAYKPRWRLNPVPEDDVTYVIACQMYNSRGCMNIESVRRILKGIVEDKEDINMIVTTLAHFDVCKEVTICTPDIKVMEIQEGLDAGVTLQEEHWPQLATDVLQQNSTFNDDDLPTSLLQMIARNLHSKDSWLDLSNKLGISKMEINSASAQFQGKFEEVILHTLKSWKQRVRGRGGDAKKELLENLDHIKREDLKTTIMEYDCHAALASQLKIVLPTWNKLKKEKIHIFPSFLKNGEIQMSNYWQVIFKKMGHHKNFSLVLSPDHGHIDEVFLKCCEIILEQTLSHQIWRWGFLTEGIEAGEYGVLYYFNFKCTGEVIQVDASAASDKAISSYCEDKINLIVQTAAGRAGI